MSLRTTLNAIFALGTVLYAANVGAQVPLSNACQTNFGVCSAPVAPVGAPCTCFSSQRGPDPGRMIYTGGPGAGIQSPMSNFCGTQFGVCQMPFQAPVNTPCTCVGPRGPDPGRVIWR